MAATVNSPADLGLDSQAPTLTPPTANSSPRHEHATLPPSEPTAPAPQPTDIPLTFLLISGERKPMHFAPTMTVGRVKEAFWSAWTPENPDTKPPSASFLRVLHMGKVLSDDQTLTNAKFPNVSTSPAGTIVHISVRPFGPPTDEDIVKAKRRLTFLGSGEPSGDDSHVHYVPIPFMLYVFPPLSGVHLLWDLLYTIGYDLTPTNTIVREAPVPVTDAPQALAMAVRGGGV